VRSSSPTSSTTTAHTQTPLLAPPATVHRAPAPAATAPARPAPTAQAPVVAARPAETAIEKLNRLQQLVQQAYADAQAVGADGTRDALALATGLLDKTLDPLLASIDRVLASLGLSMPSSISQASAPVTAPQPTTQTILAPVQQAIDGVQSLIQRLLGRP
jgi:hypothetical protein